MQIYLSYALAGTHYWVPFKPARKDELVVFEQIARAMELFAIAHEYGHHHHGHGRRVQADAKSEEFEADQFALKICYEIERVSREFVNPYLASGAGGAVLLLALEQLRTIEELIDGKNHENESHPAALVRIQRMDSVALMRTVEFNNLKGFRVAMIRLMSLVNNVLAESCSQIPLKELAETRRVNLGIQ